MQARVRARLEEEDARARDAERRRAVEATAKRERDRERERDEEQEFEEAEAARLAVQKFRADRQRTQAKGLEAHRVARGGIAFDTRAADSATPASPAADGRRGSDTGTSPPASTGWQHALQNTLSQMQREMCKQKGDESPLAGDHVTAEAERAVVSAVSGFVSWYDG